MLVTKWNNASIQIKLTVSFTFTLIIILVMNLFMYVNINSMTSRVQCELKRVVGGASGPA